MSRTGPYAAVVGGVNMDIRGAPAGALVAKDSNPGTVTVSLGGVGRNIAHNMALLGIPTHLVTALGEDSAARRVEESCASLGVDLTHSLRVPGGATSTYLFITDEAGEMELAVSDMDIYAHLTPQFLAREMDFLDGAKLVVADANLPGDALAYLAAHCAAPLFVDPVSTKKAEKIRPILGRIHTLKPNGMEAAMLSGVEIVDEASLRLAAEKLLATGLRRVFISLGSQGALCADQSGVCRLPILRGEEARNATGCGDAFMAALAWSFWEDLPLAEAGRAGLAAAAIALAGRETINPQMSAQAVRALMERGETP